VTGSVSAEARTSGDRVIAPPMAAVDLMKLRRVVMADSGAKEHQRTTQTCADELAGDRGVPVAPDSASRDPEPDYRAFDMELR
jgi:hypothetical protein